MADHFVGAKIINISRKDFDSSFKLKKKPGMNSMVVFHQPWCGFCVQLAPEYKKLSKKAGIKVYSMNGELPGSDEVFAHFGVQGFPTMRPMSKDGNVGSKTYLENRDVETMFKFIKSPGMSGGAKKNKVVKKKKCQKCKGKCVGGQCKKSVKKCKCKGKCVGGQCKKVQKGGSKIMKSIIKKVRKDIRTDKQLEKIMSQSVVLEAEMINHLHDEIKQISKDISNAKKLGKDKKFKSIANKKVKELENQHRILKKFLSKLQKGGKKRGRGRPRDVPMKKLEKAVIKSLKKVKKMLGGKKKKQVKKARKTIKKRGKK